MDPRRHPLGIDVTQIILVFVPHTLRSRSRTGIQRVVVSLVEQLGQYADVELVTWDELDGQMRFCDEAELFDFAASSRQAPFLRPNRHARSLGRRFQDLLPSGRDICMVLPEIAYHLPDGYAVTQRVITQCLEAGWRTAAVFYDLIPIQNSDYNEMRADHERYVAQLLRCDYILPISQFVEQVLRRYLTQDLGVTESSLAAAGTQITTIALPDAPVLPARKAGSTEHAKDRIILLGTVEPRKQQLLVIAAFKQLLAAGHGTFSLQIIGSLHPKVEKAFHELIDDEPRILYRGYLTDEEIEAAFDHARFSVFASHDEGFGLPISESLSRGVPCLTAGFGAMEEVARHGGCLMVDVRNPDEIAAGLLALAADDALVARLRSEIEQRPHRNWRHYADDLLQLLGNTGRSVSLHESAACLAAGMDIPAGRFGPGSPAIEFVRADGSAPGNPPPSVVPPPLRVAAVTASQPLLRPETLMTADVLLLPSPITLDELVQTARQTPELGALPGWIDASGDPAQAASLFADAVALRRRQGLIALREANFAAGLHRLDHPAKRCVLSVVISTYNRALFVAANAAWIIEQMAELGPAVELVIVDNASTDDSVARLGPLLGTPGVRLVVNPTNVGMLGNLKVCSSLMLADHVWIIGDDDFMVPGTLRRVIRLLSVHPGLPFVMLNFGVYHRARMTPGDSAAMFLGERLLLASNPAPSGFMRVIDAGSEHDNLFTAIYPIVFRADLAAGVFNDFFQGAPFRSLVESVPTTKFILECYALAQAYWMAETGIVGNAHNSWQRLPGRLACDPDAACLPLGTAVRNGPGTPADLVAGACRPVCRGKHAVPVAEHRGRVLGRRPAGQLHRATTQAAVRRRDEFGRTGGMNAITQTDPVMRVRESGLFDAAHYRTQAGLHGVTLDELIRHYLDIGERAGLTPSALFDPSWYLEEGYGERHRPEIALLDYISRSGDSPDPHPLFDQAFYLTQARAAGRIVPANLTPLAHYLISGVGGGLDPHPLFSNAHYLDENSDVRAHGYNPLVHFLTNGWTEWRSPCPEFDCAYYLHEYEDVSAARINPLIHYVSSGARERRNPSAAFDAAWYTRLLHAEPAADTINPLVHYIRVGRSLGYLPRPRSFALDDRGMLPRDEFDIFAQSLQLVLQSLPHAGQGQPPIVLVCTVEGGTEATIPGAIALEGLAEALAGMNDATLLRCVVLFVLPGDTLLSGALDSVASGFGNATQLLTADSACFDGESVLPVLLPGSNPTYLRHTANVPPFAARAGLCRDHARLPGEAAGPWFRRLAAAAVAFDARSLRHLPLPIVASPLARYRAQDQSIPPEVDRVAALACGSESPSESPPDGDVSVIICTKDCGQLLAQLVMQLLRPDMPHVREVLIVTNQPGNAFARAYHRELAQFPRVRILDYPRDYNFSDQCNVGAQAATGSPLCYSSMTMWHQSAYAGSAICSTAWRIRTWPS